MYSRLIRSLKRVLRIHCTSKTFSFKARLFLCLKSGINVALRNTTEPNLADVSTHFNLRFQLDHLLTSANYILCGYLYVRCRGIKYKFSVTVLIAMHIYLISNDINLLYLIQTSISNEMLENNTAIIELLCAVSK